MNSWNRQANKILLEALEIQDRAARERFLQAACAGNDELREIVDKLLEAHQRAGQFLKSESDATVESAVSDIHRPWFSLGTTLASRYVLQQELGQGGMGVVFLADQMRPVRRQVALKLIKTGLDVQKIALRFEQERRALALMEHPHIAKILDAGVVDVVTGKELGGETGQSDELRRGVPYFVMEYIQGLPITDYCDRHRLSPHERLKLFIPVCQAVQHAHQKGIVHRDLKPSNILVETIDDQPIAKVIDFGVAKATGTQLTEESLHTSLGSIVGTLEYMSPEQARLSDDIDTRTDVYALGVVLYELLVGSVPHSRDEIQQAGLDEMLRVINEVDAPPPSSKLSNSGSLPSIASERAVIPARLIRLVRGDLDWIVLKALDKERNRRYDSVAGFAADIQRYLDEEPVLARPPSTWYRFHKAYRRHRAAFLAAGLAIALLLLGIIGTSTGFIAASRNAKKTHEALQQVQLQQHETETQKQISDAITNFLLSDLLQQANVSLQADRLLELKDITETQHALKKNPTILELVDRATEELTEDRINTKFPDQSLVQAALLANLGYVYQGLGEFEKAIGLLRRARAIYESEKGPEDRQTLLCLQYLTAALRGSGQKDEFLALTRELLDRTSEAYGELDQRTLYAKSRLANAYANSNQLKQAVQTAEETIRLCDQVELDDAADRGELKSNLEFALACTYVLANRRQDAVPLLQRVYESRQQRLGADHPKTLHSCAWLASTHVRLNQYDQALPLLESTAGQIEQLYGSDHPTSLGTLETLAACYHRAGNPELAVEIYENSLPRRIERHGRNAVPTLRTMANLGVNYFESGQLDRAIAKLSEVVELGRNERAVHWVVEPLARALEKNKQPQQAEQICRDHLANVQQQFADKPPQIRSALFTLSLNLLHQQKHEEAEPLLRQLVTLNERHAPENWNSFNTKCLLASALLPQNKLQEAEPLLLDGYAGMLKRRARIPLAVSFHLANAAGWLVQLYEARGDDAEAERWRQELEKLEQSEISATPNSGGDRRD